MLALKLLLPVVLFAAPYQPEVLEKVRTEVRTALGCDPSPVVVFDLDDTLINTRERTVRILKEFALEVRESNLYESVKLEAVRSEQVRFQMKDTFRNLGIENEALLKVASDFWAPRFFSDAYVLKDRPVPGAAAYVRQLESDGATIVYLTGRDIANMQRGTVENLRALGFPQGTLLMKPDAKMSDLDFKRTAIAQIRGMGEVVGVFENEPANLNLLHEAFPNAHGVFLDTIHSPKPDVPYVQASWVPDFAR